VRALAEKSGYKKNLFFAALSAHRKTSRRTTVLVAYVWGSQDPNVGREIHGRRLEMLGKLQEQGQAFGLEVIGVELAKEAALQTSLLIRQGECGVPVRRKRVVVQPFWHEGEGIPPARRLCPVSKPRFLKAQARGMR
jgi:hypothetical protein